MNGTSKLTNYYAPWNMWYRKLSILNSWFFSNYYIYYLFFNVKTCFISIGRRIDLFSNLLSTVIYTYPQAYIHQKYSQMNKHPPKQKSKHPQLASMLCILTKRIDLQRNWKMQNQMTEDAEQSPLLTYNIFILPK